LTKYLIKAWVSFPDGNGGFLTVPQFELLIIDEPSVLPQGKGPVSLGRWTSHSKYLGRYTSGKYVLRNLTRERREFERHGLNPDHYAWDPVGWFVDSPDWEKPFLILKNFNDAKGIGHFTGFGGAPSGVPFQLATHDVGWEKVT
jgi:hypothetical protein